MYIAREFVTSSPSNNSIVWFRMNNINKLKKENFPILVELEVLESKDVNNLPNFTHDKIGQTIQVEFRQEDAQKLVNLVEPFSSLGVQTMELKDVLVEYAGDESGGRYIAHFPS